MQWEMDLHLKCGHSDLCLQFLVLISAVRVQYCTNKCKETNKFITVSSI